MGSPQGSSSQRRLWRVVSRKHADIEKLHDKSKKDAKDDEDAKGPFLEHIVSRFLGDVDGLYFYSICSDESYCEVRKSHHHMLTSCDEASLTSSSGQHCTLVGLSCLTGNAWQCFNI